mmetsp:Transcript_21310/g.40786  ORF Transcript_21310/g.40786 Transcript_21310/m.40786 type:complete len:118 (-) Transcript_21310:104-457(-)
MRGLLHLLMGLMLLQLLGLTESAGGGGRGLPPWWILNQVKPAGPVKDMGSWKAITFSKEQQEQFAINEDGAIMNKEKWQSAIKAAKEAAMEKKKQQATERSLSTAKADSASSSNLFV